MRSHFIVARASIISTRENCPRKIAKSGMKPGRPRKHARCLDHDKVANTCRVCCDKYHRDIVTVSFTTNQIRCNDHDKAIYKCDCTAKLDAAELSRQEIVGGAGALLPPLELDLSSVFPLPLGLDVSSVPVAPARGAALRSSRRPRFRLRYTKTHTAHGISRDEADAVLAAHPNATVVHTKTGNASTCYSISSEIAMSEPWAGIGTYVCEATTIDEMQLYKRDAAANKLAQYLSGKRPPAVWAPAGATVLEVAATLIQRWFRRTKRRRCILRHCSQLLDDNASCDALEARRDSQRKALDAARAYQLRCVEARHDTDFLFGTFNPVTPDAQKKRPAAAMDPHADILFAYANLALAPEIVDATPVHYYTYESLGVVRPQRVFAYSRHASNSGWMLHAEDAVVRNRRKFHKAVSVGNVFTLLGHNRLVSSIAADRKSIVFEPSSSEMGLEHKAAIVLRHRLCFQVAGTMKTVVDVAGAGKFVLFPVCVHGRATDGLPFPANAIANATAYGLHDL